MPGWGDEHIRFGVLIPAHNEEAVIDQLLDSLRTVDYPKDRLQVVFVADHCTDTTVTRIRAAGYTCLDRQEGLRGKTPSLVHGLDWLRAQPDADCSSHRNRDTNTASMVPAGSRRNR